MCHTSPIKRFKRANLSSFHDWAGPVRGAHCGCLVSFRGWSVMVLWEWASKVTQLMKFSLLKWTLNYTGEFGQQNEEVDLLTTEAKPRSPKSSIVPTNKRFQTINWTISRLFCLNKSVKIQLKRGSLSELNTQGHYYNLWVLKAPVFLFWERQHTREPPRRDFLIHQNTYWEKCALLLESTWHSARRFFPSLQKAAQKLLKKL